MTTKSKVAGAAGGILTLATAAGLWLMSATMVTVSGHVYAYNNEPFNFTIVEVLDSTGTVVASSGQLQDNSYSIQVPSGGTYTLRVNQPGYNSITNYGIVADKLENLATDLNCVNIWVGPNSWFPGGLPECNKPLVEKLGNTSGLGTHTATYNGVVGFNDPPTNLPCRAIFSIVAEGTSGSGSSARVLFATPNCGAPPIPSPTPTQSPTPTPTATPTATPTPTSKPTPTATPTPAVQCILNVPASITLAQRTATTVNVSIANGASGIAKPISAAAASGQVTVQPLSQIINGPSGSVPFRITVKQNSTTVTFNSPCGSKIMQVNVR